MAFLCEVDGIVMWLLNVDGWHSVVCLSILNGVNIMLISGLEIDRSLVTGQLA